MRTNESLKTGAELLRKWNGQMEKDQAAPLLAALLYQQLRQAIGDRASNGKGQLWETRMVGPVIERILRERPSNGFATTTNSWCVALSMRWKKGNACRAATRTAGVMATTWNSRCDIPRFGQASWIKYIPTLGKYFRINVGPVRMSGSSTTVKQTTRRIGPSMRFVADTSDWDKSLMNLTAGQSGQLFSLHYSDQWEHYYDGKELPATVQQR